MRPSRYSIRSWLLASFILASPCLFPSTSLAQEPNPHAESPGGLSADQARQQIIRLVQQMPQATATRPESGGTGPRTITARLRDPQGQPLANRKIVLEQTRNSIAEGDNTIRVELLTNAEGFVNFGERGATADLSYRLSSDFEGANYSTQSFDISQGSVQGELFHFAVDRSETNDLVLFDLLSVITPRDDIFRVETRIRILNISGRTWLPPGIEVPVPAGTKAFTFSSSEKSNDCKVRLDENDHMVLEGSFVPGMSEVIVSYNVPNPHTSDVVLLQGLPPNTIDARVVSVASSDMEMQVSRLSTAEETQTATGQRALISGKDFLASRERSPESLEVTLIGMPVPSHARYFAAGLGLLLALGGLALSRKKTSQSLSLEKDELERAKSLIFAELNRLEAAYKKRDIGTKTYEQAKRTLIDSLARLYRSVDSQN